MTYSKNTPQYLPPLPKAWIEWLDRQLTPLDTLQGGTPDGQVKYLLGRHSVLRILKKAQASRESDDQSGWPRLD